MSVNVYLKDEVLKLAGAKTRKEGDGTRHEISGMTLYNDKGRLYVSIAEPTDSIPAILKDLVEDVSLIAWIPSNPSRETGVYHHGAAKAEVDRDRIAGEWRLKIHIVAKEWEDMAKLYHKIRTGSIRPTESYEGPQSGQSRADIDAELKSLRKDREDLLSLRKDLKAMNAELATWRTELVEGLSPFCRKEKVLLSVNGILFSHRIHS